jgi:Tfp pilus assembly protein PilZ
MNNSHQDKRQETRLHSQETVFIELTSAEPGEETPGDIVISNSVDLSANGLRVTIDRDLALGSILRACVQFRDSPQRFLLVTEVKWCRPHEQAGEFIAGLSLFESEGTDIQTWKEMIAQRFTD